MKHTIAYGAIVSAFLAVQPAVAQTGSSLAATDRARAADTAPDLRPKLGFTLTTSGTDRDTLGLLVSAVSPGGLAERAGVAPGNRVAELNNVSLRIEPANVGRREAEQSAMNRLSRELGALQPGADIKLRLFGQGRFRTITIETPKPPAPPPPPPAPLPVVAAAAAPASANAAVVATVPLVLTGLGDLRTQIDKLMEDSTVVIPRDTLAWAEKQLGDIERRLRASVPAPRVVDTAGASVPGLRLMTVTDELKDYFGQESDGGLLVLDANASWDPIRKGDVILRVNGQRATLDALRAAIDIQHPTKIDLLRRGRYLMVTLHPQ